MSRLLKTSLAAVGAILVLLLAGSIWFNMMDDRRSEVFRFALFEPENVLREITARAEASKNLSGSGRGLAVPGRPSGPLGPTRWTVSSDGMVEGRATERGLTVVWTPQLKDGKVEWRCTVEPGGISTPKVVCKNPRRFER